MRIEGPSRPGSVTGRGGARSADDSGAVFRPAGQGAAPQAANVAGGQASAGIEALLALQSVDDPLLSKRKKVKRGLSILDALDGLKADLLGGQIGEGRLNQLMALIHQARESVDPRLDALLEDIELRAKVELAKRGRYVD